MAICPKDVPWTMASAAWAEYSDDLLSAMAMPAPKRTVIDMAMAEVIQVERSERSLIHSERSARPKVCLPLMRGAREARGAAPGAVMAVMGFSSECGAAQARWDECCWGAGWAPRPFWPAGPVEYSTAPPVSSR